MSDADSAARRICMFVYNTMVHDARVRKEARTLASAGYDVTVLAVRDPGRAPNEETISGFRIHRVSRSVLGISRLEMRARLRGRSALELRQGSPRPRAQQSPRRRRGLRARVMESLDAVVRPLVYPLRRVIVFLRFVRAGMRLDADVYHAHDLNTLLMAWTASRLRRARLIYDTHEVATGRAIVPFRWWACFLERTLIGRADRVICTNQTRADFTQQLYGIAPPTVLRNLPAYVEPEPSGLMHERLGIPPGEKIVLYQGGTQAQRGLEQLLDATVKTRRGTVVILGSGRLKSRLLERAAELGLHDEVRFHDAVPVDELPAWTACAYLGTQLLQDTCFNHYSSLSNKLLEYMMAGVPAIASDLPEMRRVIEDTKAGILVDASNPTAIAQAIDSLLADEELRAQLSANARAARKRYCWEIEERVLVELYQGLLADDARGGARGR